MSPSGPQQPPVAPNGPDGPPMAGHGTPAIALATTRRPLAALNQSLPPQSPPANQQAIPGFYPARLI